MHIPITAAALLLSASIHASGQTLYFAEVPGDPIPAISTVSISAAGVSPDGATTYVEIGVDPTFVVTTSSQTITFVSAPTPFTNTFLENASGFRQSDTFGDAETCSFASDGSAACVNVVQVAVFSGSTKLTKTFSASVVPFYTLGAGNPARSSTGSATSPRPSSTPTSPSRGVSRKTHTPLCFALAGVSIALLVL